jgi:hypothetical protein
MTDQWRFEHQVLTISNPICERLLHSLKFKNQVSLVILKSVCMTQKVKVENSVALLRT